MKFEDAAHNLLSLIRDDKPNEVDRILGSLGQSEAIKVLRSYYELGTPDLGSNRQYIVDGIRSPRMIHVLARHMPVSSLLGRIDRKTDSQTAIAIADAIARHSPPDFLTTPQADGFKPWKHVHHPALKDWLRDHRPASLLKSALIIFTRRNASPDTPRG